MVQPIYFLQPFDPTAYPSISGAQLLQYTGGMKNTDESGFLIWTADVAGVPQVPDAATYTELQRFIWVRQLAASVSAYVWNSGGSVDVTYAKWVGINISGIATGSIVGSMIADNTIPDSKIISLDWSKITGAPTFIESGDAAGGDLTGTYPDPAIGNLAVTTGKINDLAVTTAKIDDEAVTIAKMNPSGVGKTVFRTNAAGTAVENAVITITEFANPASAADVGKVVRVKDPYTDGYELASPNSLSPLYTYSAGGWSITAPPKVVRDSAHGLAGAPQLVYWFLKCTSADGGYAAGDTIAISSCNMSGDPNRTFFTGGANATNIFLIANDPGANTLMAAKKDGSGNTNLDLTKWEAYVLAQYFA